MIFVSYYLCLCLYCADSVWCGIVCYVYCEQPRPCQRLLTRLSSVSIGQVRLVAELLLEKETISHNDVSLLIGARPWSAGKEYDEFVSGGFSNASSSSAEGKEQEGKDPEAEEQDGGATPVAVTL